MRLLSGPDMFKEAKRNMVKCKSCQVEAADAYIIQVVAPAKILGKFGIIQALPKVLRSYGPFCKTCLQQVEEHIENMMRGEMKGV